MGYKVLITLDLPNVTDEQRKVFYEILAKEKWSKINSLTTTWQASFEDDVSRDSAISIIQKDLLKAKNDSKTRKVEYAMQMDKLAVIVSNL